MRLPNMANLPAADMKSLGEFQDLEGWSNDRICAAYEAVADFKMHHSTLVQTVLSPTDAPSRSTQLSDLNIKPMRDCKNPGTHLLDVIMDFEGGPLPTEQIVQKMRRNTYKELSPPLCAKEEMDTGYTMNINIHEQVDGKFCIVKLFIFNEKVHIERAAANLVHGQPCVPHWVGPTQVYHVKKVLLYLFERLPGTTVLYTKWSHQADKTRKDDLFDLDKRREGYMFIRTKGPRANKVILQ